LRAWAASGLLVLFVQIALGGWTSTNYAALQCMDFPTCQGQWWPPTDFASAFELLGEPGVNYEGGRLDNAARVAIHLTHRIGALVTLVFLATLAIALLRSAVARAHRPAGALLALLVLQVGLGISNVLFNLPLSLAVAHNGGAALLLVSLVALNHSLRRQTGPGPMAS
jgi:cytochrome c oxidase assembly protein subunit 15